MAPGRTKDRSDHFEKGTQTVATAAALTVLMMVLPQVVVWWWWRSAGAIMTHDTRPGNAEN